MKVNFGLTNFEIISSNPLINSQLQKYHTDFDVGFVINIKYVASLEKSTLEAKIKSKFYSIYQIDETSFIQEVYDENHTLIGNVIYSSSGASIQILEKYSSFKSEYIFLEYVCFYFILKNHKGIVIHSSCFVFNDYAYCLVASSGTGKSTHASLWEKYNDSLLINDDKNIVLLDEGILKVFPNPFSGKSLKDNNLVKELKGIIILKRNLVSQARKIKKIEGFKLLTPHILNTSFMLERASYNLITDSILEKVNFFLLECNVSKEAYLALRTTLEENL